MRTKLEEMKDIEVQTHNTDLKKIYLSGGPDAYSSSDEHFAFFAGLDENHINGIYFNGKGDSSIMSFEDETLYWLIRNSYRTEEHVDKDAYAYAYRDTLDRRAQRLVSHCASPSRTDILTGYEVVQFYQKEVLRTKAAAIYCWEPAFLADSADAVPWVGGCTSMPTAESAPMSSTPIL